MCPVRWIRSRCGSYRRTGRPRRTTRKRTIRTQRKNRRKVNRRPDPSHRGGVLRQAVVAFELLRSTLAKLRCPGPRHWAARRISVTTVARSRRFIIPVATGTVRFAAEGNVMTSPSRADQLILDDVTYYQVVFTLPRLSEMAWPIGRAGGVVVHIGLESFAKSDSLSAGLRSGGDYGAAHLEPGMDRTGTCTRGARCRSQSFADGWEQAEAPADVANSDGHYLVDATSLRESFQLTKVRHFGGWSCRRQTAYMDRCQRFWTQSLRFPACPQTATCW